MDHLPLPMDGFAHAQIKIPYVCNDHFTYDGNGFSTYPRRAGVTLSHLTSNSRTNWDEWAPFLQAWLWFGLIREVFGHFLEEQDKRDVEVFVDKEDTGRKVLSTRGLNDFLSLVKFRRLPDAPRLVATLRTAYESVNSLTISRSWRQYLSSSRHHILSSLGYKIVLSIQVLTETIYATLLESTENASMGTDAASTPNLTLVDILLERAGWCPSHMARLPRSVRTRLFLSYITPFDADDHIGCVRGGCKAIPPDQPIPHFVPQHAISGCACELVHVSEDILESTTIGDRIPLISFSEENGGCRRLRITSVTTTDEPTKFLAITHVRHLGLGNLGHTALPYCQLAFLQTLADDLTDQKGVPFYIDTLCLPIHSSSRLNALKHVGNVYQIATKVLLLDPSLYNHNAGSPQDCIFRIRYSAWKQRLWTLQEGAVAKELYVRFRNKTRKLQDVVDRYECSEHRLLQKVHEFEQVDEIWLKDALASLACDVQVALRIDTGLDSARLKTMLRFGYLALPAYRYFCEDFEAEGAKAVLGGLRRVYCKYDGCGEVRFDGKEHVIDRLRIMSTIDLPISG